MKAMASSSPHYFKKYFISCHVPDTAGSWEEGQACEMPPLSHGAYRSSRGWMQSVKDRAMGGASGWLPGARS